MKKQQQKT